MWEDHSFGGGNSKWKGHETGACSLCSRNSMEANGAEKVRDRAVGEEVREKGGRGPQVHGYLGHSRDFGFSLK